MPTHYDRNRTKSRISAAIDVASVLLLVVLLAGTACLVLSFFGITP